MTLEEKLDILEDLDAVKESVARELYEPMGGELWKVAMCWPIDEFVKRARALIKRRREAGLSVGNSG